jgi:hypothetical protein
MNQNPNSAPVATKTSPWVWVALATSTVSLVLIVLGCLIALGFGFFGGHFGPFGMSYGPMDEPGMPSREVLSALEEPCEAMRDATEKITPYAPIRQAKRELGAWAETADDIATAVDGTKPKGNVKEWGETWKAAGTAVRTYAAGLGESTARLDLPSGLDGMYSPPPPNCMFPTAIMALDPDHAVGPDFY